MYENFTHQALPSKEYRELLGTAICVFNSNNSFIIENILAHDHANIYSWYDLIDRTSGQLKQQIEETISRISGQKIFDLFSAIVKKRNRISHSFQITDVNGEQILRTKDENNNQYNITADFLMDFIKDNEEISNLLHSLRGY